MASGDSAASPIAIASPASISSIGSPCPTLAPRESPAVQTPQENPGIVTHKEWVVPPRPKPGRKPATDTPPTKRKAQNRAAQRAFRERRAARVNELEDKLKEVTTDAVGKDLEFREQIRLLTENNSELARENAQYKLKVEALQKELEAALQPTKPQQSELTQVASPAPSTSAGIDIPSCGGDCSCQDIIDKVLCDRPQTTIAAPTTPPPATPDPTTPVSATPAPITPVPIVALPKRNKRAPGHEDLIGCGSCSSGGDCSCYNAATSTPAADSVPLPKRISSPLANSSKRTRTVDYLDDLETDFTTAYMRPRSSRGTPSIIHVSDPCGFCSDGTPCVCVEMANAMDMEDSDIDEEGRQDMRPAPMLGMGMVSPPSSSAGDSVPLRRMLGLDRPLPLHPPTAVRPSQKATVVTPSPPSSSPGSACKPGGCDQCKSDPMSTLFCQSVATWIRSGVPSSKATAAGPPTGGCCGGNANGGGCCKDIKMVPASVPLPKRTTRGKVIAAARNNGRVLLPREDSTSAGTTDARAFISCSAVYQTLSRHHAFDEAAADLGALVRPLIIKSVDGQCPQVEVSSVRDVLKMLDRKFGRG